MHCILTTCQASVIERYGRHRFHVIMINWIARGIDCDYWPGVLRLSWPMKDSASGVQSIEPHLTAFCGTMAFDSANRLADYFSKEDPLALPCYSQEESHVVSTIRYSCHRSSCKGMRDSCCYISQFIIPFLRRFIDQPHEEDYAFRCSICLVRLWNTESLS